EGGDAQRYPADNRGKVNEFRTRPVLPTPHGVVGSDEPPWPGDLPTPASGSGGSHGSSSSGQSGGRREQHHASHKVTPRTQAVIAAQATPKPIEKGQERSGRLVRPNEKWVAVFDGDAREAQIVNPSEIDAGCSEGTLAEFYITEQSKRVGIKCRFKRVLGAT